MDQENYENEDYSSDKFTTYNTEPELIDICDVIDDSKYMKWKNRQYTMFYKCWHLPKGKNLHPLEEGHEYWANVLHEYMKSEGII